MAGTPPAGARLASLANGRWPFVAMAVVPLAAVAAALFTQHVLGMLPCPWCVLQRAIFVAIALAALPGCLTTARPVRLASALAVDALAACGIAAALWQHFVAAASASCTMTLADRIVSGIGLDAWLPEVFAAMASCADAKVSLLGLPYEFYSLGLFIALGAVASSVIMQAVIGRR
jgi:disulfide bond formation protein DsbB